MCADHLSHQQEHARVPEKVRAKRTKRNLLHAESGGSVGEDVGRLGVLGGEGAEVFDVDGGHVDGDGFLFREKHCRK